MIIHGCLLSSVLDCRGILMACFPFGMSFFRRNPRQCLGNWQRLKIEQVSPVESQYNRRKTSALIPNYRRKILCPACESTSLINFEQIFPICRSIRAALLIFQNISAKQPVPQPHFPTICYQEFPETVSFFVLPFTGNRIMHGSHNK